MFNHNTLEQDIKRLSQEIAEKRNLPEHRELTDRELVKQTIEPLIKKAAPPKITPSAAQDEDDSGLPSYLKESPPEIKLEVEKLVDSVFHSGLIKTVDKARASSPFVLDAFHDALADKLYDELKKRKLL